MKKAISLTLALILVMSTIVSVNALEITDPPIQIENEISLTDIKLQTTIDEYFELRNTILSSGSRTPIATISATLSELSSSQSLHRSELNRMSASDNLSEYHNVHLISSSNNASIQSITEIDNSTYEVDVYEWTWIQYNDGKSGATDIMGYGTDHTITLRKDSNNSYQIINDIYDESEILGEPSNCEIAEAQTIVAPTSAVSGAGVNSGVNLNVNKLIDYADTWVVHEYASNMQNPANYNTQVYGYYSADCANFTSQCLKAGGMQNDYGSGKNNENWDGTQWWFDTYPNPNYENYDVSPPSWRYVPKFIAYWEGKGYELVSATSSSVYPGNPVINNTGHVGICVGYNTSGTPIINAHNRDVYHVPYTMIGSGTRTTIQIATSNEMVYKPSSATAITPTTTAQSISRYLSEGSNHYYTFSVTTAGYYTFGSAYSGSTHLDTKGTLYKEQETSNGKTLYLYELASDDDSGDGLNFNIRAYLQPSTYYIRVRAYADTSTGSYSFTYRKG